MPSFSFSSLISYIFGFIWRVIGSITFWISTRSNKMSARNQHIYPRMSLSPPFSADVPDQQKVPGETLPRRNILCKDGLKAVPCPEVTTLFENLQYSVKRFGDKNAVGSRPLINVHKEQKKVKAIVDGEEKTVEKEWQYFELGGYSFLTFNQYNKLVLELGSGLRKLGLVKGSKVQLYGATRYGSQSKHTKWSME